MANVFEKFGSLIGSNTNYSITLRYYIFSETECPLHSRDMICLLMAEFPLSNPYNKRLSNYKIVLLEKNTLFRFHQQSTLYKVWQGHVNGPIKNN